MVDQRIAVHIAIETETVENTHTLKIKVKKMDLETHLNWY